LKIEEAIDGAFLNVDTIAFPAFLKNDIIYLYYIIVHRIYYLIIFLIDDDFIKTVKDTLCICIDE